MVTAAILGGGRGTRLGSLTPKQFFELEGESIIIMSLRAFKESRLVDAAVMLVPEDFVGYTESLVAASSLSDESFPVYVLPGGENRSETLFLSLEFIKEKFGLRDNIVLTHDAARPFINKRIIEDNIIAAKKYGASNTCVPATDTVFLSSDGRFIQSVPERKNVFHAQTPQTFNAEKLYELCKKMNKEEFYSLTDGCSVFINSGEPVFMVRGCENNIKITYPGDIERARDILKGGFKNG
ncbi:MAG: 2-C-methyl-D-erythritol 4-phosphate cytidylyltransferase [Oscillospiraceae bacterium]|nr:2-C-methyl-D-erythritol 4-phosphate cytidylyltransferase [Oscillospiraceae bacterium]